MIEAPSECLQPWGRCETETFSQRHRGSLRAANDANKLLLRSQNATACEDEPIVTTTEAALSSSHLHRASACMAAISTAMHAPSFPHAELVVLSRAHARDIGSAFQNRKDLRLPICAALIRMCTQTRRILQVQPGTMLILPSPAILEYL